MLLLICTWQSPKKSKNCTRCSNPMNASSPERANSSLNDHSNLFLYMSLFTAFSSTIEGSVGFTCWATFLFSLTANVIIWFSCLNQQRESYVRLHTPGDCNAAVVLFSFSLRQISLLEELSSNLFILFALKLFKLKVNV